MSTRLLKFLIAGGTAALVEYTVFLLLQYGQAQLWLLVSQTISYTCGFIVSFALNRGWVYRSHSAIRVELARYALLAAINLAASNAVMLFLVSIASTPTPLAKFLVMGMVATWNYLIFAPKIFHTSNS